MNFPEKSLNNNNRKNKHKNSERTKKIENANNIKNHSNDGDILKKDNCIKENTSTNKKKHFSLFCCLNFK